MSKTKASTWKARIKEGRDMKDSNVDSKNADPHQVCPARTNQLKKDQLFLRTADWKNLIQEWRFDERWMIRTVVMKDHCTIGSS